MREDKNRSSKDERLFVLQRRSGRISLQLRRCRSYLRILFDCVGNLDCQRSLSELRRLDSECQFGFKCRLRKRIPQKLLGMSVTFLFLFRIL